MFQSLKHGHSAEKSKIYFHFKIFREINLLLCFAKCENRDQIQKFRQINSLV